MTIHSIKSLLADSFSGEWGSETGDVLTPVLRTANFNEDGSFDYDSPAYRCIPEKKVRAKRMQRGDIVLEKSGGTPNRPVGIMAYYDSDDEALCSNFNHVLRFDADSVNPYFMFHQLRWLRERGAFAPFTRKTTGLQNLQMKAFVNLELAIPSRAEQDEAAIAIRAIDSERNELKSQIGRLDELVKSRFVEMFGDPLENPKQLPIMRIDEIADVQTGATPLRSNAAYYGGSIPWVKTGEVAAGLLEEPEETITDLALQETNCKLFPAGTILIAMYGQGDTRGKAAILRQAAATNQACAAILLNEGYDADFILAQLNLRYEDLRSRSLGGNQKNLSLKIVKAYELVVPPIEQQKAFMAFVQQVDKLKSDTQQAIDRLQMLYDSLAQEYFGS